MRFIICLLACLPYLASSAVQLFNYAPASGESNMYPQYATFTWDTDKDIVSPVTPGTPAGTHYYGLAIKADAKNFWDPTITTYVNGASLSVLLTSNSYQNFIIPDMSNCQPKLKVDSADPTILRITFIPPAGQVCTIKQGDLIKMEIPWIVIAANPTWQTSISMTISTYFEPTAGGTIVQDTTVPASKILLNAKFSTAPLRPNSLDFEYAYPSTTLTGVVPNFLKLQFTPAITLASIYGQPATIAIHANDQIFAANPPKVIFAVGSCTGSYAETRVNNKTSALVRSSLLITLGPVESCILPYGLPVVVVIPQAYLAPATKTGYLLLNIATLEEPIWQWSRSFYTTGPSTVRAFTAVVPSTTTTDATASLTVVFTLNKALIAGNKIVLGTFSGVFRTFLTNIAITFSPSCTGTGRTDNAFSEIHVTPSAACIASMVAGSSWSMVIPESALLPNLATGTVVIYSLYTTQDPASLFLEAYTTTPSGCDIGLLAGFLRNPNGVCDWFGSYTVEERAELVNDMALISPYSIGSLTCQNTNPYVWLFKVRNGAQTQTVTSPNAPTVIIFAWGTLKTVPLFAVVVTYPVNNLVLWNELKLSQNVGTVAFVVRIERMLSSGLVVNANNALSFEVLAVKCTILQVLVIKQCGVAGVPVAGDIGAWGQGPNGNVLVNSNYGTVFVGYCGVIKAVDPDGGSDEALLGLLALIAVPFLICCCCLALLALFLLRKKKDVCCPCPCPDPCAVPCQVPCTECTYTCAQLLPAPTTSICPVQSPIGSPLYAAASPYVSAAYL